MAKKRWVVCADGTWNKPESAGANTNVVKLARAVAPADEAGTVQVVYYHKGVGERGGLFDHLSGGAFGVGIDENIEDIYLFLASNYAPGDELFLFGFSRGAYTVRSLAGLIRNSGLLMRQHMSHYKEAYALYRQRDDASHPNSDAAKAFRSRFAWQEQDIRFIGVWDTVGALGVPVTPLRFWSKKRYEFHDVKLSSHVSAAYQALAIDEKRKPFAPAVWQQQPGAERQAFEQAWFPGVHCNVGGGYAASGLSDGALVWMCDRARSHGLALIWPDGAAPAPQPTQVPLQDSMTAVYRLLGDGTRHPGAAGPQAREAVHVSTQERISGVPGYRPAPLLAFLERTPAPDISRP
jgi:uncharacterized protein (DUF2235 family)